MDLPYWNPSLEAASVNFCRDAMPQLSETCSAASCQAWNLSAEPTELSKTVAAMVDDVDVITYLIISYYILLYLIILFSWSRLSFWSCDCDCPDNHNILQYIAIILNHQSWEAHDPGLNKCA